MAARQKGRGEDGRETIAMWALWCNDEVSVTDDTVK